MSDERGTLRVYLGAAPGVGKTFAMLNEGRRRFERGEDTVVAVYETHGRKATAEQIGNLEVLPRKKVEYRGTEFEEMDLKGLLKRRPQLALVDELAHTNVPGSKHAKRWQDVEEILDAGIDVIATLNIQHLESVNDVVARITGVKQQETIPDEVVRRAEQLQLVDLAPETVRARLARGDIYPPERIDAALGNYFRPGNLGALRELALLWIADRVEEGLQEYRERHGIEGHWETRERVMVSLSGSADGELLVRRAARMAQRMGGDFVAVHVSTQDGLSDAASAEIEKQKTLVESLGGSFRDIYGTDIATALVEAAHDANVSQIVVGASTRSRWAELWRGSVINSVVRQSGEALDVHVISIAPETERYSAEARGRRLRRMRSRSLNQRRAMRGLIVAGVGLPLLTALLTAVHDDVGLASDYMLYLLLVVVISAVGGIIVALSSAVIASLLVNWFFTPPVHTLTIGDPENVLSLVAFLIVAGVVSGYVALAESRTAEAQRSRADAEALIGLSGSNAVPVLLERLQRAFALQGVSLLRRTSVGWEVLETVGERPPVRPESGVRSIDLDDQHVLLLAGEIPPDAMRVVEAFAGEVSDAIDQQARTAELAQTTAAAAGNELRSALLSAVSHELRTPIAVVKANATSLLQSDVEWTEEQRREFLEAIDSQADNLNGLVGNLLDMSRIQVGAVHPALIAVGLDEVIPSSLRHMPEAHERVTLDVDEGLPPVLADPGLLERVFANVIGNAIKYSPADSEVMVRAGSIDGMVDVRVVDRGPGVPDSQKEDVFLPFQRLGDSSGEDGVGLGMAVAKGFTEAVGGEIEVEDTPGGGLTVVIRLPVAS